MKKSLFLIPALAITLASCSNDDPKSNIVEEGVFDTNYLTINLVQAPDMATRLEDGQTSGKPTEEDAIYEEGKGDENVVSKVRFYFFDGTGSPSNVKTYNQQDVNFYDWDATSNNDKDMPNVEKKLNATLILQTKPGGTLPKQVVAILNPEILNLGDKSLSLTDLQAKERAADFASYANATYENANSKQVFVMANSVYATEDEKTTITATSISSDFYANSQQSAEAHPLPIYVERNVAKVRVSISGLYEDNSTLIALKDKNDTPITIDNKQVYLKLKNWNVTADTDKGNLFKSITTSETGWDVFGSKTWNLPEYHRSYWANNVDGVKQNWHTYDEIASKNGKSFGTALANSLYVNENAPKHSYNEDAPKDFTKVILAGELITKEGDIETPITVVKYAGQTFAGKDALITSLLNSLGETNKIYSYEKTANDVEFSEIKYDAEAKDVELVTAMVNDKTLATEEKGGRFNVYLKLSEEGSKKAWTRSKDKDKYENDDVKFNNAAEVNTYLSKNIGKAQIYENGLTYYYFPIKHLGEAGKTGDYGVVRNHIYDCKITALTGLGTPVYDPTEDIYPEKPQDDDTFIAAQINILSWRLVTQDVKLEW